VKPVSPVVRISMGLVVLTCTILVGLDVVGVLPRPVDAALQARVRLCETLAAHAAAAVERDDFASIRATLGVAVRRNDEVLSAGVRAADGRLLVAAGRHDRLWIANPDDRAPSTHVRVPLFKAGRPWATIEVRFEQLGPAGVLATLWAHPMVRLLSLVSVIGFVVYLLYMRRTLRHLDPSAVIPTRVQAALDMMAEGVLLLDEKGRVVLANSAFAEQAARSGSTLLGAEAVALDWCDPETSQAPAALPWLAALREGLTVAGTPLQLRGDDGETRSLIVKAAPVWDGRGRVKGAIATFDDVTELERKSGELETALVQLEKTQEEIRLQNEELQELARCDPLTGVSNRRFFLESFAARFEVAVRERRGLCCIMVDIDHFKRINDAHGHLAGDEVIRRVAEVLKTEVRSTDCICRYGGEEFLLVLQATSVEKATLVAERLRRRVSAPAFARVPVTASFGISTTEFGPETWNILIKQADDALYASKIAGRDRVTRWDQLPLA
jgi:diguanylate cyclase (GGDEF)-like protein